MQPEIKQILERLYGLRVKTVRTLNAEGKKKRGKHGYYRAADYKKAYVHAGAAHQRSSWQVKPAGQRCSDAQVCHRSSMANPYRGLRLRAAESDSSHAISHLSGSDVLNCRN